MHYGYNYIFDRYGPEDIFSDRGTFVSPLNTPFPERALPSIYESSKTLTKYKIASSSEYLDVEVGTIIPWFNQMGGEFN